MTARCISRTAGGLQRRLRKVDSFIAKALVRYPMELSSSARMVSFTFDDFPQSAADRGAELLDRYGARGTFYASLGLIGQESTRGPIADESSIQKLAASGHEIGCHTLQHLDLSRANPRTLSIDLHANRARAADLGLCLRNFAYPYGRTSALSKAQISAAFSTARTTAAGMIRGRFDGAAIPAMSLDADTNYSELLRRLDNVDSLGGWLIFYSHDVSDAPSRWGVTPAQLERLLLETNARNLDLVTIAEAAKFFSVERNNLRTLPGKQRNNRRVIGADIGTGSYFDRSPVGSGVDVIDRQQQNRGSPIAQ